MENKMEELHYSDKRDERVKQTSEVFTPDELVQQMLDSLDIDWDNPPQDRTFLDPTCGSGQFLVALAKRGIPVDMLYGVDIMDDNIRTTKSRLYDVYKYTIPMTEITKHLHNNIVQEDALTYHYDFNFHVKNGGCLFLDKKE